MSSMRFEGFLSEFTSTWQTTSLLFCGSGLESAKKRSTFVEKEQTQKPKSITETAQILTLENSFITPQVNRAIDKSNVEVLTALRPIRLQNHIASEKKNRILQQFCQSLSFFIAFAKGAMQYAIR